MVHCGMASKVIQQCSLPLSAIGISFSGVSFLCLCNAGGSLKLQPCHDGLASTATF